MSTALTSLFVEQLKLCDVKKGDLVGIISEYGKKNDYVDAVVAAAQALEASALVLTASSLSRPDLPPYDPTQGPDIPALLAAAANCNMVVDVTVEGLIHSDVRTRITGAGRRMLFVAEPPDVLRRLMSTPQLRERVLAGADILKRGRQIHVTSPAGTDITADISGEDLPITPHMGFVADAGRWDHWPSGFIACFPRDRTAQGVIVLQPGDALIPWQRYVKDTVRIEVKDGFITRIEGDGFDAANLRAYFEAWSDHDVFATSHMGWGVHPTANWAAFEVYEPHRLYGQELRSVAGNFMWSTGSNRFANRYTPAHLDFPMRGCTVEVDDRTVVRDGQLLM